MTKEIKNIIAKLKLSRSYKGSATKRAFLRNSLYEIEVLGGYLICGYFNQEKFYKTEIDFISANYLKVQNKIKDYEILFKVPLGTYSYETLKELIKFRVSHAYLRTDEEYLRIGIDKALGERQVACNIANKHSLLDCWNYICERAIRFPPNYIEIGAFSTEYKMKQNKEISFIINENQYLKKKLIELQRRLGV